MRRARVRRARLAEPSVQRPRARRRHRGGAVLVHARVRLGRAAFQSRDAEEQFGGVSISVAETVARQRKRPHRPTPRPTPCSSGERVPAARGGDDADDETGARVSDVCPERRRRASSPTGPESTSGSSTLALARRRRRALGVVSTSSRSIRARIPRRSRIEPRAPPRRSRRAAARLRNVGVVLLVGATTRSLAGNAVVAMGDAASSSTSADGASSSTSRFVPPGAGEEERAPRERRRAEGEGEGDTGRYAESVVGAISASAKVCVLGGRPRTLRNRGGDDRTREPMATPDASSPEERRSRSSPSRRTPRRGGMPRNGHKSLGRRVRLVILLANSSRVLEIDRGRRADSDGLAASAVTSARAVRLHVLGSGHVDVLSRVRLVAARERPARVARSRATKPTIRRRPATTTTAHPLKRSAPPEPSRARLGCTFVALVSNLAANAGVLSDKLAAASLPGVGGLRQYDSPDLISFQYPKGWRRGCASVSKRHRRRRLRHHREDHRGGIQQTADERTRRGRGRGRGRPRGRDAGIAKTDGAARDPRLSSGGRSARARWRFWWRPWRTITVVIVSWRHRRCRRSGVFDSTLRVPVRPGAVDYFATPTTTTPSGIRRRGGTTPPWCPKGDCLRHMRQRHDRRFRRAKGRAVRARHKDLRGKLTCRDTRASSIFTAVTNRATW